VRQLLELPHIGRPTKRHKDVDVLIGYSKSIIWTSEDYIQMVVEKKRRKEGALKENEVRKVEAKRRHVEYEALKLQKELRGSRS
jgi:hypothetical protein